MAANEIIKRLEWLIFNFPVTGNPKDETERLSNCINLYCQDAVGEINRQKAEIERLNEMLDCSVSSERNTVDNIPYECAEAIKKFAEKVDYLIGTTPSVPNRAYRKLSAGIKNLVKETVGDGNA